MSYGNLDCLIDELLEFLIMADVAILDYFCPLCARQTVHRMYRENPDGGYDEVGIKCRSCNVLL
jgi:hypothetical protein